MANTLVQFRVEESIRENAVKVCENMFVEADYGERSAFSYEIR